MTDIAEIGRRIETLLRSVEVLAAADTLPDAAALPPQVSDLCRLVESLPAEQCRHHRQKLEQLIAALDRLREEIGQRHRTMLPASRDAPPGR